MLNESPIIMLKSKAMQKPTTPGIPRRSPIQVPSYQWSFPVTVGFTILAIRTVLVSAIVLFIRVISCDIVHI